jgi:uncharacterized phage protein (TIGR01671 family)
MKIKSRVWLSDEKKMIYPNQMCKNQTLAITADGTPVSFRYHTGLEEAGYHVYLVYRLSGSPCFAVPMLWIGRVDSNDREIYHYDIIQWSWYTYHNGIWLVELAEKYMGFQLNLIVNKCKTGFCVPLEQITHTAQQATILGNIYENPEMVGGNDESD